jgi:RNA polymerase sigma-70 factor (ECF subfamily)
MTGSLHDAEDLVQETLLRAWKAYDRFEGKSSVRTWLHRIATNTCLTALESRRRRRLPTGLGAPSSDPTADLVEGAEVPWLESLPESAGGPADPAAIVGSRESVRLAFVAALQHLSPRQRAVLVLRDVLQWKAAEVADAIGTSTAAVNSLLQRARSQLDDARPSLDDRLAAPRLGGRARPIDALYRRVRGLRHRAAGGAVHQRGDVGDAAVRRLVSGTAGDRSPRSFGNSAPRRRPAICG